jgi:hypothetical protein
VRFCPHAVRVWLADATWNGTFGWREQQIPPLRFASVGMTMVRGEA